MTLNFDRYAAKANRMINEVAIELGDRYNPEKASRVLRSVLHALRNRLTIEESLELIAHLPLYIKALYVDDWRINKKYRRIKHIDDFFDEVYMESSKLGFFDFPESSSIYNAVTSVFRVLKYHVTTGEINDLSSVLPKELKKLFEDPMLEKV